MSPLCRFIFFSYCLSLFTFPVSGKTNIEPQGDAQTFIVRVQNEVKPLVFSDVEKWYLAILASLNYSNPQVTGKSEFSFEKKPRDFLHVYRTVFHGFSARLTNDQAQELKNRPGVLAVLPDRRRRIQTTRTPQFLGLSTSPNTTGLLTESDSGSNVVIGLVDSGIWPEHPSFRDDGLSPIPSHWKGECVEGENFTKAHCNKKIIGARYFIAGYEAGNGSSNSSIDIKSARDSIGHGTHTASTAAGSAVGNASFFGFAEGVAVGIAPKARIAVYKVCWIHGCMESDILAGLDKAVEDGVDIISISIGAEYTSTYNLDPIAIGSFAAMEKGILISAAAGNIGPLARTVVNVAPWITTVGAGTIDRKFPANLVLGDGQVLKGMSLFQSNGSFEKTYFPLIHARNSSWNSSQGSFNHSYAFCKPDSLKEELVRGKIVVCDRGRISRVAKGDVVQKAGGIAVIVSNVPPVGEELDADAYTIPGLGITETSAQVISTYINSNPNPTARMVFQGTELGTKPAPVVSSFSSRGPNPASRYVLKPDVIAPGVHILAAWPDGLPPTESSFDKRRTEFNIVSGTSMSCPHVSGIAALLKGAHPDWSPAMIRSSLMTTAYTEYDNGEPLLDEASNNHSTIWDMGAGHVNPEKALDPGLVYDISSNEYINFLCASNYTLQAIEDIIGRPANCEGQIMNPWDLNYPAIIAVFHVRNTTLDFNVDVTRTVTNVGEDASSYTAKIVNPRGATVTVNPEQMMFDRKGQKQSYMVKIKGEQVKDNPGNWWSEWGKLIWSDGKHNVTSPIVIYWTNR